MAAIVETRAADSSHERPIAIYGALAANVAIAVTKLAAALATRSSGMLAEVFHSTADSGNELLLLLGSTRARRPADAAHPFGYGREVYFWSLIVALLLFGLGGGLSLYEGVAHLLHPRELGDPTWAYLVLATSFVFEGASLAIAGRQFLRTVEHGESIWQAISTSKDPLVLTIVFEDSAALAGLIIAAAGLLLSERLRSPLYDAAASLGIGVLLASVGAFLAAQSHRLLVGVSADRFLRHRVLGIIRAEPLVVEVREPLTMHLAPEEVLLNLEVHFRRDAAASEVAAAIDRLEHAIRAAEPSVKRIYLEAASWREVEQWHSRGGQHQDTGAGEHEVYK